MVQSGETNCVAAGLASRQARSCFAALCEGHKARTHRMYYHSATICVCCHCCAITLEMHACSVFATIQKNLNLSLTMPREPALSSQMLFDMFRWLHPLRSDFGDACLNNTGQRGIAISRQALTATRYWLGRVHWHRVASGGRRAHTGYVQLHVTLARKLDCVGALLARSKFWVALGTRASMTHPLLPRTLQAPSTARRTCLISTVFEIYVTAAADVDKAVDIPADLSLLSTGLTRLAQSENC